MDLFCHFASLATRKIKILKKWKKHLEILYIIFTHVYHKWQAYHVWFLRYRAWWMFLLFFFLDHFLSFYPSNSPKTENFKKTKQMLGDVIMLHKCTKNHNHTLYCSFTLPNCYFPFWAIFYPITPLAAQNQN